MFEVKWGGLADYGARLDYNDIKFWPDAPQKDFFVRSIIRVQFSLIGESCQTAVAVPFLSETTVLYFWIGFRQSILICIPGICWRHKGSSKHSTDCPSQYLQTIYLQRKQHCNQALLGLTSGGEIQINEELLHL